MQRLNRERFSELSQDTRNVLRNMAELREKHPDKPVIGNNDFIDVMSKLFKIEWDNINNEKILLFTKRVGHRVNNMNVNSLLGSIENLGSILDKDEHGYIIIPKESWNDRDDLNCFYAIQDGCMWMNVCVGEYKVGYIIMDKEFSPYIELLPWSLITMIRLHMFPSREEMKRGEKMFMDLCNDFPEITTGDTDEFVKKIADKKFLNKIKKEHWKSEPVFEMHGFAHMMVLMAFKAFVFLKTSEVYSQVYVPDPSPSFVRRKKGFKPLNYIQVDTTWDMDIDVNTPFPVRGHFVHQPCKKDGKWTRKLIYVEQYMKKGYHRRAKKTIEKM